MSYPQIAEMLQKQGHPIVTGTVYKYAQKFGIGRNASESKRNLEENPLDHNMSYMTESTVEAVDGFLLGDGGINYDKRSLIKAARLQCSLEHQEFCNYLMGPFYRYKSSVNPYRSSNMSSGTVWSGRTYSHPDFYKQHQRWYPSNIKQPPNDIRITPLSVMMWYLGDGSVVVDNIKNTIMLRLSTDGFAPERVEFLVSKLQEKGINCHRNGDNRIQVDANGIPLFFNFIGHESPIACYSYKFEKIPTWRFTAKHMKEVADELKINYDRLSYWVKDGKVPCLRVSEKDGKPHGKPWFLPEHIEVIRNFIKTYVDRRS